MRVLLWLRWLAVALALGIVAAQSVIWLRQPPVVEAVVEVGVAAVGGPFVLTDQHGTRVTDRDLRGKVVVLTFGWTRDPDVTPALMQLLGAALDRLGPKNETIQPVFVTIDPERDKTAELYEFSKRYSARLIALGGPAEAITRLAADFRLPVTRVTDTLLPGGYSLDLPAVYYVLGVDGRFRGVVPYTTDSVSLAADIEKLSRD